MSGGVRTQESAVPAAVSELSVPRFCLFLAAGATLATGQLFGLVPLLPAVAASWGDTVRLGLPLFAAGYATGMVAVGSLSGRLGARRVLAASLGGGALVAAAGAWAPTLALFLALRFVEGAVLGGFPPAAFVATTQRVRPDNRLLANSAMVFGLLGSAGVAGLASRALLGPLGWHGALTTYAVLLGLAALVALRLGGIGGPNASGAHPYRLIRGEAFSGNGAFAEVCGAFTMAAFVTTNGLAQQGEHPILALVVVLVVVLALLAAAKVIVRRPPEERRAVGLTAAAFGVAMWVLWPGQLVPSLVLVAAGATLVVPASIQQVVGGARRSVPVAVACFTCCLFIGGALAGLAVTGLVHVVPSTVGTVLVVALALATAASWLRWAHGRQGGAA